MKKVNLVFTTLALAATITAANAGKTTTTTSEYTYIKQGEDASSSSTKKTIVSERKTDKEILKLLDAKIDSYPALDDDVSFSVQDGVVCLKGTVDNTSERDHAELIAESIAGVVRVDNLLNVD